MTLEAATQDPERYVKDFHTEPTGHIQKNSTPRVRDNTRSNTRDNTRDNTRTGIDARSPAEMASTSA